MPVRGRLQSVVDEPKAVRAVTSRTTAIPALPPPHVVIVGGGITGLAAAWALVNGSREVRVTVIERSAVVGGHLRVGELAGIPVDEGPEAMVASRPEAVRLARDVGLEAELVAPASVQLGVWSRGHARALPRGQYLGVSTDLRALATSQVLSWPAVMRIPLDRVLPPTPIRGDVSVGEFVATRLGPEVVATMVEPLLGLVYAGRARELSMAATMPALFRAMRRERSLLTATQEIVAGGAAYAGARRGAPFRGLVGGVGRLAEAVAAALVARGVQIRTGCTVRELQRRPTGWELTMGPVPAPETLRADAVIVAVPPLPASRMLARDVPAAAGILAGIESASVAVIHLAYPADQVDLPTDMVTMLVPSSADRAVRSVTFSDLKWDWTAVRARERGVRILRVAVGRHGESEVLARPDGELVDLVRDELADMLGVRATPVDQLVSRWGGALPQYRVGHRELIAGLRDAMDRVPGIEIAGAALDGVGVAACIGTANESAGRLLADLDRIRSLSN